MKTTLALFAVVIIALCAALSSLRAQPPTAAATKIAVFASDALGDDKTGVKKLIAAFRQIEIDIKPLRDEIQGLRVRYDAAAAIVNKPPPTMDPKAIAAKADEAESLKSDIERKQQDGQKLLAKRTKELTDPIYQEINTELIAFAKGRGFDIVFDQSKLAGVAIVLNPGIDITTAFIAEYNSKHPLVPAGVPVKTP